MTIIVEDGTIVSNANSYVSPDELRIYAADRGISIPVAPPTAPVTTYVNCAGSGDRTTGDDIVTVTSDITLATGTFDNLVDGNLGTGATNGLVVPIGTTENDYIMFDFGEGNLKYIDAMKFYGNTATELGAWVIEASNDSNTWIEQKASFTLATSALGVEASFTPTSTLGFRCYRLRKGVGTVSTSKWLYEVEFKIADEKIEQLMLRSMDYLESLVFKGVKHTDAQLLQWPRGNVSVDGYLLSVSEIPKILKEGQMEIALAIDNGEDPLADLSRTQKRAKVGPVEVEYEPGSVANIVVRINSKIFKLLQSGGSGGNSFTVSRG